MGVVEAVMDVLEMWLAPYLASQAIINIRGSHPRVPILDIVPLPECALKV